MKFLTAGTGNRFTGSRNDNLRLDRVIGGSQPRNRQIERHIAIRYLGDPFRYPELARLSDIRNPDLIYPGNKVRIIRYRWGEG